LSDLHGAPAPPRGSFHRVAPERPPIHERIALTFQSNRSSAYNVAMSSHEPGRNDPCPCGSQRKFKQCCLASRQSEASARLRWRTVEGRVVPQLLEYALEHWGREFFLAAWAEFFLWNDVPEDVQATPEFESPFIPWFVFHYVPDPNDDDLPAGFPQVTVGRHYLQHSTTVGADERTYIERAGDSPFSFFAATAVEPGRSIHIRDLLTGGEFDVLEQAASTTLEAGSLLFSSVLTLEDAPILLGCAPYVIPPSWHNPLIDFRESLCRKRRVTRAALFALETELRDAYHSIVDSLLNPALPQFSNTDGDPLEPIKLEYILRCTVRAAFERLKPLTLSDNDEELLAEAEREASGELRAVTMSWLRKGNRQHRSWDNTVLGTIQIAGGRLVAEVNSEKRARRLKRELASRLAAAAVLTEETVLDVRELLERRQADCGAQAVAPEPEATEEMRQAASGHADLHWREWLDSRIPALGNKTPRQAAKTALGRERLEALFSEYSWRDSALPNALRANVPELRRSLGMT
jgi:hypothetical protein